MKKHIVCFGDSNTHGYCADPADCGDGALLRFNEEERWTCLLQKALGEGYLVLEEGLSGRTTVFPDPLHEGLCGVEYIHASLKSHEPVSLVVLMLGTNDVKERFAASAACVDIGMQRLVNKAKTVDCWGGKAPNILVVAPPAIDPRMEQSQVGPTMGSGCAEKSAALAELYRASAKLLGVHFLDGVGCELNQIDFMHLTRRGHATLAQRLAQEIPKLI